MLIIKSYFFVLLIGGINRSFGIGSSNRIDHELPKAIHLHLQAHVNILWLRRLLKLINIAYGLTIGKGTGRLDVNAHQSEFEQLRTDYKGDGAWIM